MLPERRAGAQMLIASHGSRGSTRCAEIDRGPRIRPHASTTFSKLGGGEGYPGGIFSTCPARRRLASRKPFATCIADTVVR